MKPIAVVTGANRGLGLATAADLAKKGHTVVLTSRDNKKGHDAAESLSKEGLDVVPFVLDVASPASIDRFCHEVLKSYGRVDVLVNNAGVYLDAKEGGDTSVFKTKLETLRATLDSNTIGAFFLCQKLIPGMVERNFGRVVNVSSGMGQLAEMNGGYASYRISKTALNAVSKVFAEETKGKNVLVNSICPGWVRTDMGGPQATRSIEQGIDTIVWAATLPASGPTGGFFRDRKPIAW